MTDVITTRFIPGFRLIDGSALNAWKDQLNAVLGGVSGFIQSTVATGLTAAGTTRVDALVLTKAINVITTAAASTGAVLPPASTVGIGGNVIIFNDGASAIKVYAAGSDTIDAVAGTTGVTLTNALRCEFFVTAALTWKSAKLGATST